ncbi:MAG: SH3 domain-containing protein [Spirochaetales bacterium]
MDRMITCLLFATTLFLGPPEVAIAEEIPTSALPPRDHVLPAAVSDSVIPVPDRIESPTQGNRNDRDTASQLIVLEDPAFAVPVADGSKPVVELDRGEILPIIQRVFVRGEPKSSQFYVTLHPEVGLATVSTRVAAERLTSYSADLFNLPGLAENIDRLVFATRPRTGNPPVVSPDDEELLIIPQGDALQVNRAITVDLSTELPGGDGVVTFSPLSIRVEDITGDGSPELAIDSSSRTVTGSRQYDNRTLETFWLEANGGDPKTLLHLVHQTYFDSSLIAYTHAISRNDSGLVQEIRSYAERTYGDSAVGVDKSVQEYAENRFEWSTGRTRMSGISPRENPAGLRDKPDDSIRVSDWLSAGSNIRPVNVHLDDDNDVWLKIDVENGASGWIEETEITWQTRP